MNMKTLIVLVIAAALLGLTGCTRQTPEDAMAKLCTNVQNFDAAVQQMQQITPETTVGDAKKARAAAADAWQQVTRSAEKLSEVRVDSIQEAWTNLERTIDSISNRDTIAEATAEVVIAATQVRAAVAQVGSVSCPDLNLGAAAQPAAEATSAVVPPAEAVVTAPQGAANVYTGEIPLSDGAAQALTLTLHPNGEASMVFGAAGGAESPAEDAQVLLGSWSENADGALSVALDRLEGGTELALAETFLFTRQDGQLVAVEYNREAYGPSGFTMQATMQAALPVESAVITSTGSTPITPTTEVAAAPAEAALQPAGAAVGPAWQLQQMQQGVAITAVPDPSLYTLTLFEDGTAQATAACSVGNGAYQMNGSSISFQLTWGPATCAAPSLDRQFATYLSYANAYQQQDGALVIYFNNSAGQMLFAAGP